MASSRVEEGQEQTKADDFGARLTATLDPSSSASEAYRTLRTSLLYTYVDTPPKVIVVTSPGTREGKSTTCANLGVVLAQAGKSTLIIDCDLRRPVMHNIFELRNLRGVVDILGETCSLQESRQEPLPYLTVISAGTLPPNPAEILGSRRFTEFLDRARQEFEYVLIDTPPVGIVSDPLIVSTQADGVLLVVDAQRTRRGTLRQAVRSLMSVGTNILGTVMNNAKARDRHYQPFTY